MGQSIHSLLTLPEYQLMESGGLSLQPKALSQAQDRVPVPVVYTEGSLVVFGRSLVSIWNQRRGGMLLEKKWSQKNMQKQNCK